MKTLGQNKIKTLLLGASALAFLAGPATAGGYIQTLGLGQRTSSLAGAVTAKSQDFDAFYTNPAGAADFNNIVIGLTAKIIDTSNVTEKNSAGTAPVIDTWKGEHVAIAPALGAYLPVIPGSVVMGLGIGAPFALAKDEKDQPYGFITGNEDSTNIELLYIEAAPTIAVKLTDRINIGGAVNIGIAKHFKLTAKFDDFGGFNNVFPSPSGQGLSGIIIAQSDDDLPLPVAPWEFATDPTAVTFTLGTQIRLTDTLKFGITYREETPNEWEGSLRFMTQVSSEVASGIVGAPTAALTGCTGPTSEQVCTLNFGQERFTLDFELPRHLQFGFAWLAMPNWELSVDAQWTNWSDATGLGSPAIFQMATTQQVNATTNGVASGPFAAFTPGATTQVGIGAYTNFLSSFSELAGLGALFPQGLNTISANYQAEDAWSFMVGSDYKINETWTLLTGYQYDEAFMPVSSVDLNTFSSDKHYITGGVEYTTPTPLGLVKLNVGGQLILYEDRTINPGASSTLGGLGQNASVGGPLDRLNFPNEATGGVLAKAHPNAGANANTEPNAIGFGFNEDRYEFGGYLWTVGASATIFFGATEAASLK